MINFLVKGFFMNVVFLDFDGPLYPKRSLLLKENLPNFAKDPVKLNLSQDLNLHPFITYWKMDHIAVAMMNNLANKGCIFVLSTSWISLHDLPTLKKLLEVNGFIGKFHEDWSVDIIKTSDDNLETRLNRAQSIADWISRHPEFNNRYLIVDDLLSAPEMAKSDLMAMYGLDYSRIFLADLDNGISLSTYNKMINIL